MRLGALISLLFTVGCAHAPMQVSVENASGHDVCAVRLWNGDEDLGTVEGGALLDGARREFTVPSGKSLRIEAVDCRGQLVDSREVAADALALSVRI
jgi:hypothetical protein